MIKFNNINKSALAKIKKPLLTFGMVVVLGGSVAACSKGCSSEKTSTSKNYSASNFDNSLETETTIAVVETESATQEAETLTDLEVATKAETETELETIEFKATELDLNTFNSLVDEIVESNKNVGFNTRREAIEALVYAANINIVSDEVASNIASRFVTRENLLNSLLETVTSYNMAMVSASYTDEAMPVLANAFVDEIDKNALLKVQQAYALVARMMYGKESLTDEEKGMVTELVNGVADYMLYNGKIDGYTSDELNSFASLAMSLLVADGNAYLATTGYVNNQKDILELMDSKNKTVMTINLSQTYSEIDASFMKASSANCFDEESKKLNR